MRKSVLRSMATKDLSSHPLRIHSDENSFFAQVLSFHIVAHSFARTGTQLFYFQAVPHSFPKNTRVAGTLFFSTQPHLLFWKADNDRPPAPAPAERHPKEEPRAVTHPTLSAPTANT